MINRKELYESIMKDVAKAVKKRLNEISIDSINEMDYRAAALAHGANYNGIIDYLQNHNISAKRKADLANNIRLKAISLAVHDNLPHLKLEFIENDKANQHYTVVFNYQSVKLIDDTRFVLYGQTSVSGNKQENGYIEFNFSTQSFYRVKFFASGSIRRIYKLIIDPLCKDTFVELLAFLTKFLYAEEDYTKNIDDNGSTPSKKR